MRKMFVLLTLILGLAWPARADGAFTNGTLSGWSTNFKITEVAWKAPVSAVVDVADGITNIVVTNILSGGGGEFVLFSELVTNVNTRSDFWRSPHEYRWETTVINRLWWIRSRIRSSSMSNLLWEENLSRSSRLLYPKVTTVTNWVAREDL